MAIVSLDGIVAAAKQRVVLTKTATRTSVAANYYSVFDLAGNPGAGTLAGSSNTAGVVPTDATTGCPTINAFGAGATGYLAGVRYASSVACRIAIFDLLFKAGTYTNAAATVNLAAQPSFLSREPNGTGQDVELWYEQVTATTGNPSVAVQYTNPAGTTARSTGTVALFGTTGAVGRCARLPLQAGDTGVQTVTQVVSSVATAGTFNILVMRRLWEGRVKIANDGGNDGPLQTGMPIVYADSALVILVAADSTSTGIPDLTLNIVNG